MAQRVRHTVTPSGGEEIVIIGDTDKLNEWFNNPALTPDIDAGPTNVQRQVGGYNRKRYPGDLTGVSVAPHTRTVLVIERATLAVLPGQEAYLERPVIINGKKRKRVTQFTFVGDVIDLHAFCNGNCSYEKAILRTPKGKPMKIEQTAQT